MPLAIESIDEQTIIVGTEDYTLEIEITDGGSDTTFETDGSWEGFYIDWDEDDTLTIKSDEVERLLTGAEWIITATDGSETVTQTIIYNVVPSAPVIEDVGTQNIFRGVNTNISIEISNKPSSVSVKGAQVGHKFESETEQVNLIGNLPVEGANITTETFEATITASNGGGEHERDVSFEIAVPLYLLYSDGNIRVTNRNAEDGAEDVPVFDVQDTGRTNSWFTYDGNEFFVLLGNNLYVYSVGSTTHDRTISVFTSGYSNSAIDVDDNYIYIRKFRNAGFDRNRIYRYHKNGTGIHGYFSITSGNSYGSIAVDDTYIYITNQSDNRLNRHNKLAGGTSGGSGGFPISRFISVYYDLATMTLIDSNLYYRIANDIFIYNGVPASSGIQPIRQFEIEAVSGQTPRALSAF